MTMNDSSVVVAIILDKEGLQHWQSRMIYLTTVKPEHGARMLRLDYAFQSAEAKQLLYEAGVIWTWSRTAWEAIDPLYITCLREELDHIPYECKIILGDAFPPEPERASEKKNPGQELKAPDKLKQAIVQVEVCGRAGQLLWKKRPSAHGRAWIKYTNSGEEAEISLELVQPIAIEI